MASKTVLEYATQLYSELEKNSTDEVVKGDTYKVFRGKATEMFSSIGISNGYYTPVWTILREQGCITQLQRGARGVETVIALHHAPDHDADLQNPSPVPLTKAPDLAILVADVEAIKKSLGGLNIVDALANHENRLKVLEAETEGE